ncbi:MAG: NlpC/P60 family protein [Elusimicrobiota bacterium]
MKKFFYLLPFTFYLLPFTCLYSEYFIQAGLFKDKDEAITHQLYLASHNYPVILSSNGYYKIIVGPYEQKETVEFVIAKLLAEENISAGFVDEFNPDKLAEVEETDTDISDEVLNELISLSFDFLGVSYRYGGTDIEKGIDCSYFMQMIYSSLGTILPRTSRLQFKMGKKIKRDELIPGDLVFFRKYPYRSRINHVGLYIGNDEFIHASYGAKKVTINSLNETYYRKRFSGARRPL